MIIIANWMNIIVIPVSMHSIRYESIIYHAITFQGNVSHIDFLVND